MAGPRTPHPGRLLIVLLLWLSLIPVNLATSLHVGATSALNADRVSAPQAVAGHSRSAWSTTAFGALSPRSATIATGSQQVSRAQARVMRLAPTCSPPRPDGPGDADRAESAGPLHTPVIGARRCDPEPSPDSRGGSLSTSRSPPTA